MIVAEEKKNIEISGDFETKKMTAKIGAKAFDIFSNKIYTRKEEAVIRELSCNAWDSHQDSGIDRQFLVHLPTSIEPWLAVRDFGNGMSHDKIMSQYSTYFDSDKEDSNSVIGCLGIGSKSPFCLADSFTVTAFDGQTKRIYNIYKDENNEPVTAMMTQVDCDEPSGIEVKVSIEESYRFNDAAVGVFRYFDEIPEINNAYVVERIKERKEGVLLDEGYFAIYKTLGNPKLKVLMGNVAYSVPDSENPHGINGYFRADLGSISFDPGREKVELTEATRKTLKDFNDNFIIDVVKKLQEEIKGMSDVEAVMHIRKKHYGSTKLNEVIRNPLLKKIGKIKCSTPVELFIKDSWREKCLKTSDCELDLSKTTKFVKDIRGYTTAIREYVKSRGHTVIVLTDEQQKELGVTDSLFTDLSEFDDWKPARTSYGYSREKIFKFNGRDYGKARRQWDSIDDLPDGQKVYVRINRFQSDYGSYLLTQIAAEFGITIYGVKNNCKLKGDWIELKDFVKQTVIDTSVVHISSENKELVKFMADCSTNPKWKELQKIIKTSERFSIIVRLGLQTEEKFLNKEVEALTKQYPMLQFVSAYQFNQTVRDYVKQMEQK